MDGALVLQTVNAAPLESVPLAARTVISPVVAPEGTVAAIWVPLLRTEATAAAPLNRTVGDVPKL